MRVSTNELIVVFFRHNAVTGDFGQKVVHLIGVSIESCGIVASVQYSIRKLLDKQSRVIRVSPQRVETAACGDVAIEISVFSEKLGESARAYNLARRVALAVFICSIGADLCPEEL